MSNDMVFNIKQIFDGKSPQGALWQHNKAEGYYIASYQRGFKWSAEDKESPVWILMDDLISAFKNKRDEYYLQFITTKDTKHDGKIVLEVIDGQQRLTTLTLLLSVLAYKKGTGGQAISNGLLIYNVRPKVQDFFNEHVYKNIDKILPIDWNVFLTNYTDSNEQDIFYLFHAAKKINELIEKAKESKTNDFYLEFEQYILENVKLLLSNIDRDIDCEEIFSNLNGNKVPLTSTDLIKGLLLTNITKEGSRSTGNYTSKGNAEIRALIGYQWDELSHWANRNDVKRFYFDILENDDGLGRLLHLLAITDGFKGSEYEYTNKVFHHLQAQIQSEEKTSKVFFNELKDIKLNLEEWFNDNEIYNTLGYLLSIKVIKIQDFLPLLKHSKTQIKKDLNTKIREFLSKIPIDDLEYNTDREMITDLLLALSIFTDQKTNRFNFMSFREQEWSLEHIFPQTPDEFPKDYTLHIQDFTLFDSLLDKSINEDEQIARLKEFSSTMDIAAVYKQLTEKFQKKESFILSKDESTILYKLIRMEHINSIGNLALLTKSDNSSNGNGMFNKKRLNIVKRLSKGRFVPKHTYDVFSKLLSGKMIPDLTIWTTEDIQVHAAWIKENLIKITKE